MRRLPLSGLVLLLALGWGAAARAATIEGTHLADRLVGTAGADVIRGFGGNDFLRGGPAADRLFGGNGHDKISTHYDGFRDVISCGAGVDIVNAELQDTIAADCETVSRQLSRDRYTSTGAQHETQVEPDSYSFGSTVVAVYQVGRFYSSGAANIGFATSRNSGRSWTSGLLPGLSVFGTPAGRASAVTDPAVAYDAAHRVWLVASLAVTRASDELLVSRSGNGISWNLPVVAARGSDDSFDKEWIACDNWIDSPFRGRCYLSYLDLPTGAILTKRSTDGGLTWSEPAGQPAAASRRAHVNGAQPVPRPDGSLLIVYTGYGFALADEIAALRSVDGGVTFAAPQRIAAIDESEVRGVRSPPFPSVEVDPGGTVYVAWQDCGFSEDCSVIDIAFVRSRNGVAWSAPTRVPTGSGDVDRFMPGLGVNRNTLGANARVAITYHSLPVCGGFVCPGIDVWLIRSANGGGTWGPPRRLTAESMPLLWIADTGLGKMLADYISTSFAGGVPIGVFAVASAPVGETFQQAIFAVTRAAP